MKILTKLLAERLKKVLSNLIYDTQSAFIRGRQISDCILMTSEVYHALKSKNVKD